MKLYCIYFRCFQKKLYIEIVEKIKNNIIEFLGAQKLDVINENKDVHVRTYTKQIPKVLEKKLYDIYKPHNEKLYEILGRKIEIWEKYYDKIRL